MENKLPIKAAKEISKQYNQDQVIIVAYDRRKNLTHVATYGKTLRDCAQAAEGGNVIKRTFGFPEEDCNSIPKRWSKKPKVLCLCGSTRFKQEYEQVQKDLTLKGIIVISVGLFGHIEGLDMNGETKKMLDELHLRKIDMSDGIFVINVGEYIGESTKREIAYAKKHGKEIHYLVEDKNGKI